MSAAPVLLQPRPALHRWLDALAWPFTRRRLAAGWLIDAARRRTGLSAFGPEGPFDEALGVLCDSLEQEAALSPFGRFLVRQTLQGGLEIQLRLQEAIRKEPAILSRPVRAPLVIIGMPRTGTTILHELMALDPANRCPLSWEAAHPFPLSAAPDDAARRIAMTAREFRLSERLMPGVQSMHRMGAELPQECVSITATVFASMQYSTVLRVPSYTAWLNRTMDHAPVYAYHRRFLQYLQGGVQPERWVLKSPAHLWQLPALLAEYPDARLVQTHRDPLSIFSSLASMVPVMRGAYAARVDRHEVAREWAANCTEALNASLAARESGVIRPEAVCDLHFRDFMSDPAQAIGGLYERFGLRFEAAFAEAIRAYVAANPAGGATGHRHRFADSGLDPALVRPPVARYQAYFGVPDEVPG